MEILKDKVQACKDCGTDFTLSAGEQEFFLKKKWSQPKRCKVCRKVNRDKDEKKKKGTVV